MSAATAGILGALAGLGVVLLVAGLRRAAEPEPSPRLAQLAARVRQEATLPRVAATLVTMAVVAAVTRWPSGTVLAGLAAWYLPRALGPDREHARALERIEAIATWTEMLRDTISAAAGLEQAILAAEPVAPAPVREHVTLLAARIRRGNGCPPRCAPSPPRPPTPPPTWSSRRCCWAPSSRPATWPSCWAASPTPPASRR